MQKKEESAITEIVRRYDGRFPVESIEVFNDHEDHETRQENS